MFIWYKTDLEDLHKTTFLDASSALFYIENQINRQNSKICCRF